MALVMDAYVTVPDSGYSCSVRRNTGTWRNFTITTTENGLFSAFLNSFVAKAVAAYPSEINLTGSINTNGFVNLKTGASVTMSLVLPSELATILGDFSTSVSVAGTTGTTATVQPSYYILLPNIATSDEQYNEGVVSTVYSDNKAYTTQYAQRTYRDLKIRFSGYPRSTTPNYYYFVQRFTKNVLIPGVYLRYYPDTSKSTSAYNDFSATSWGYQNYIPISPNSFNPQNLVKDWDYHWLMDIKLLETQ